MFLKSWEWLLITVCVAICFKFLSGKHQMKRRSLTRGNRYLEFRAGSGEILEEYDHYWVDLVGHRIPDEAIVVADYANNTAYVIQSFLEHFGNQPGLVYRNDTNVSYTFSPEMKLTPGHYTSKILCSHKIGKIKWIGTTLLGMGRIRCPLVAGGVGSEKDRASRRFIGRIVHQGIYYIIPVKEIDDGPNNITVTLIGGVSLEVHHVEIMAFDCEAEDTLKDKEPKLDVFQYFWADWRSGSVPQCAITVKEENTTELFHIGNSYYPGLGLMPVRLVKGATSAFTYNESKKYETTDNIQVLCSKHNKKVSLERGTMWSIENTKCPRIRIGNNDSAPLNFMLMLPEGGKESKSNASRRRLYRRRGNNKKAFSYAIFEGPVKTLRMVGNKGFARVGFSDAKYYDYVVDCKDSNT